MKIKNKSIKNKILISFLILSAVSLSSTILLSEVSMLKLRNTATNSNEQIGSQAADSSESALIRQAVTDIADVADAKAQVISGEISQIAKSIELIAAYTGYLYTNTEDFLPVPFQRASECSPGELVMQWGLAPGISEEDVKDELYLHGNMESVFDAVMKINPTIYSIYISTESGINSGYDAFAETKSDEFEGRNLPWYENARNSGALVISETYQDIFGRGLTVSMSMPCYGKNNVFIGVVGLDILIEDLNEMIIQTVVGENGYAMLMNSDEKIISAPGLTEENERDMRLFLGENYTAVLAEMKINSNGAIKSSVYRNNGNIDAYIIWSPVKTSGWNLVFALPVDDILAPAYETRNEIERLADETAQKADRQILFSNFILVSLFALVIVFVIWTTARISVKITNPITVLEQNLGLIAGGNLDTVIDIKTGDEIERLGNSVNSMTKDLKEYIFNLQQVTTEKERINSDLRIATDIQADMLPKIFPPYSDREDLRIAAFMQPAKEVGGDFYDFFFLDDAQTKIALVIADVSGKGVPAALFMVIAKILIKNNKDLPADEILRTVNNLLCADNNSTMFVTTYYSVLDISTGKYIYASAGHNPPVLYRSNSKEISYLTLPKTPPLAIFPNKKFVSQEIILQKGDALLLYTDGVTEAFNTSSEMYGTERLLESVAKLIDETADGIVDGLYKSIKEFAGEEPQSDDITLLFCKFIGID